MRKKVGSGEWRVERRWREGGEKVERKWRVVG